VLPAVSATEFGVGRGEVAGRERREEAEFAREAARRDDLGERVRVRAGRVAAPRTPSTSRASRWVGSFVPPPTVPTSRLAKVTEA